MRHAPKPRRAAVRSLQAGDIVRAVMLAAAGMTLLAASIIALYAIKSKLGINLLAGPSPLHDLIFVSMRQAGLV